MRITAAILALLIALLSCLPCADLDAACSSRGGAEQRIAAYQGPAHEHQDLDLCSPFCHCACCAVATEITAPFRLSLRRPVYLTLRFHDYKPAPPVHICIPVWEPPR